MQLARNLAVEWGPQNVRANCIAPGLIKTDFARALWENPEIAKKATKGYALRRVGEPDEIAGAAVFLGSRAGSRSEEHTSELQSLMRISYAVFCLKKKIK